MVMGNYTVDWFGAHIPTWEAVFAQHRGLPGLTVLEIGSFQGRSAVWMLENLLTHDTSRIFCVDTFEGSDEHSEDLKAGLFQRFCDNIQPHKARVRICRGRSSDVLKTPEILNSRFDIVYIDGDHRSASALEDAILAFPLLKEGGVMVFDDYNGGDITSIRDCHIGIECFLRCFADRVRVVRVGYQLFLQKK